MRGLNKRTDKLQVNHLTSAPEIQELNDTAPGYAAPFYIQRTLQALSTRRIAALNA